MLQRFKALLGIGERRDGTLKDPWTALLLGVTPTAAGVSVSPETAMRCAPVFACVRVIAETIAQLPLHLYERLPNDGRKRATDHPLYLLLAEAANDWTPASEFRLVMQTNFMLHGNAYAYVGRSGDVVSELIPLDPRTVAVEPDQRTMVPRYIVTDVAGGRRNYDRREILHLRGVGSNLYQGDSPVMRAREAIALSIVLEQHGAGLFGRGARPAGVLKAPKPIGPEALVRLRESFERMFQGGLNAGKTAILEDGMDFTALQLSSVDAQFLEMRKFQLQEIARVFRVPLSLINDLDRITYNNAESLGQQFLTFCLLPILKLWRDAISISLLTPAERRTYYADFLVDDLARADLAARFTAYSQAINAGIFNPNEIRQMENRGPYAGGETFMRPVNTAPAPKSGAPTGGAA
jgi:HK97 family phage portal protein